jgi:hypothetical protein
VLRHDARAEARRRSGWLLATSQYTGGGLWAHIPYLKLYTSQNLVLAPLRRILWLTLARSLAWARFGGFGIGVLGRGGAWSTISDDWKQKAKGLCASTGLDFILFITDKKF